MKRIKKSDCTFDRGYILGADGETVIALPHIVCRQITALDYAWQVYNYLNEQEPACEGPTLTGFKYHTFDDEHEWSFPEAPETPAIDARVEETIAYLDDIQAQENHGFLVEALKDYSKLLDFCAADSFFASEGNFDIHPLKCAYIGSPLELTVEDVTAMLEAITSSEFADWEIPCEPGDMR